METIRNQKLFEELKKAPKWETLFDGFYLKDQRIPVLLGGLDHIEVKPRGVYFFDIGMNGKTNSFVIRPE